MAGPWLYVIAKSNSFDIAGEKIPGALKNYAELVDNERLSLDRRWYVQQNCRNVEIADKVLIYSGERGIVGYATVKAVDPNDQYVELDIDFSKCRVLLVSPIDVDTVRAWPLNPRKNNLTNLAPVEAELLGLLSPKWDMS